MMILVIYHHSPVADASTIMEHVDSFEKYSSFKVVKVNTAYGIPRGLKSIQFAAIVLHYSLFGSFPFQLNESFRRYIASSAGIKVAFFQDEMQHCRNRFEIIKSLQVDIIFSLLEPKYYEQVYLKNTSVKYVKKTLTGYVCDSLIEKGKKYFVPFENRIIDVGYRARNLPLNFGRGAREKADIAEKFFKAMDHTPLKLDISTREQDRIYGDGWYKFVANCRFMLGVMAGTSIFDLTGKIKEEVDAYLHTNPQATFEEVEEAVLAPYEENINYRTISPRIFECAALRTCMILYRDDYQGILTAGKHYIALEKDFSNINSVFRQMENREFVERILENAYTDVIASGKWHYKEFVSEFDETLVNLGCHLRCSAEDIVHVKRTIANDALLRHSIVWLKEFRSCPFPGRKLIKKMAYRLGYKTGNL